MEEKAGFTMRMMPVGSVTTIPSTALENTVEMICRARRTLSVPSPQPKSSPNFPAKSSPCMGAISSVPVKDQ